MNEAAADAHDRLELEILLGFAGHMDDGAALTRHVRLEVVPCAIFPQGGRLLVSECRTELRERDRSTVFALAILIGLLGALPL